LRIDPFSSNQSIDFIATSMPNVAQSEAVLAVLAPNINATEDSLDSALSDDLKQREYKLILQALKHENVSRKNVSDKLGISPRTLRYKIARMRESGIDVDAALTA
jgi:two-component system response regulator FlrC